MNATNDPPHSHGTNGSITSSGIIAHLYAFNLSVYQHSRFGIDSSCLIVFEIDQQPICEWLNRSDGAVIPLVSYFEFIGAYLDFHSRASCLQALTSTTIAESSACSASGCCMTWARCTALRRLYPFRP